MGRSNRKRVLVAVAAALVALLAVLAAGTIGRWLPAPQASLPRHARLHAPHAHKRAPAAQAEASSAGTAVTGGAITFASAADLESAQALPRRGAAMLVLDLDQFESDDSPAELAVSWRQREGPEAAIECWLTSVHQGLLARVAGAMVGQGCTRVIVVV